MSQKDNATLIEALKALPPLETMGVEALQAVIKDILKCQEKTSGIPCHGGALIALSIRDIGTLEAEEMRGIIQQILARQSVN